jgi:hypothetical protein
MTTTNFKNAGVLTAYKRMKYTPSEAIRGKPGGESARRDFEKLFGGKPGLDSDVMDFLAIAGWITYECPTYRNLKDNLTAGVRERYRSRRATLSRAEKVCEKKFAHSLADAYCMGEFRTIRELKAIVEGRGLVFPYAGRGGLNRFNEALKEYGIEPTKLS